MQHKALTFISAVFVLGMTAFLYTNLNDNRPLVEQVAHSMVGSAWYKIEQSGNHTGFMRSSVVNTEEDQWALTTLTVFQPIGGLPTKITQRLTFAGSGQYQMTSALYTRTSVSNTTSIQIDLIDEHYEGTLARQGSKEPLRLDWQFSLLDQLALEIQLLTKAAKPGTTFTTEFINFENLSIGQNQRSLVSQGDEGYVFSNTKEGSTSTTYLDSDMLAISASISNVFIVKRSTKELATVVNPLIKPLDDRHISNHSIPLDERLKKHEHLKHLKLGLTASGQTSLQALNLPPTLTHTKSSDISASDANAFVQSTLRIPSENEKIIRILESMDMTASDSALIAALVSTTHQQLTYADNQPAGSVLTALSLGQGECTDFADLFTTLARAAGLPARTVFGIAYSNSDHPSFMFHAWNEVLANGQWQGVDPTWNQVRLDATHIKLSDDLGAALLFASYSKGVRLKVLEQSYF